MQEFIRVVKFTIFSISAAAIELGVFALFNELLHLPYWACYLSALVLSVLWNFTLNRKYTFRSAANVPAAMGKVALFYLVFTPVSTLLEHSLTIGLGWNEYLVTILNMLLNFATEFLYQRFYVFGKSIDSGIGSQENRYAGGIIGYCVCQVMVFLLRLFYPPMTVSGTEHLPEEPVILVANHAQIHGPIFSILFSPVKRNAWCASEMLHLADVPDYAYQDFWSKKPVYSRWLFRIISYVIAPLSVCFFGNLASIPVYRDVRIITTFRKSIKCLQEGTSIYIFPEHDVPYNGILYDFQDKFIDLARFYYKKTGLSLAFVPTYVAPARKETVLGEPIRFNPDAPMDQERERIRRYLMEAITAIATQLPEHIVVPYPNIPKRDYPTNKLNRPPV